MKQFEKRPVRFLKLIRHEEWMIKVYSISAFREFADEIYVEAAITKLNEWLQPSKNTGLQTYHIATLILHECKEGCFAIINWWIDDNMLQHFVYLSAPGVPVEFKRYSDSGIVTCVWELAVLWHERNAWIEHILKKSEYPDFEKYFEQQLNEYV